MQGEMCVHSLVSVSVCMCVCVCVGGCLHSGSFSTATSYDTLSDMKVHTHSQEEEEEEERETHHQLVMKPNAR